MEDRRPTYRRRSVAEATVLFNTTPVFACVLSAAILRKKPPAKAVGGIIISLCGITATAVASEEGNSGNSRFFGDLLVVAGALAYAFYETLYAKAADGFSPAVERAAMASIGIASAQ